MRSQQSKHAQSTLKAGNHVISEGIGRSFSRPVTEQVKAVLAHSSTGRDYFHKSPSFCHDLSMFFIALFFTFFRTRRLLSGSISGDIFIPINLVLEG